MKRLITLLFFGVLTVSLLQAQEMDRVPKQYSLEAGYRYVLKSEFTNQASHGYTAIFDYAWQLSGFHKKKASYITVPIGYTQLFPDTENDNPVRIISYGWTVRHELAKDKKVIPWMGYALLLNQYKEIGVDGKVFGHQTRFSLGTNFMINSRLIPFVKIEYTLTNYPIWGQEESVQYNFIEVKTGVRL